MPIGPTDPIDTNDINEIRVGVLGRNVDDSIPHWTTAGAASGRNALNVSSGEKIVNRAINALDIQLGTVAGGTSGFANRFNGVIGDEGGPDQQAFNEIGNNLIQAVHGLVHNGGTTPGTGGGGSYSLQAPTNPSIGDLWATPEAMLFVWTSTNWLQLIPQRTSFWDKGDSRWDNGNSRWDG